MVYKDNVDMDMHDDSKELAGVGLMWQEMAVGIPQHRTCSNFLFLFFVGVYIPLDSFGIVLFLPSLIRMCVSRGGH
jgi:hypothetical protein